MAAHADLGGGQPGESRLFHGGVAITAIDAVVGDVMFMRERHRLIFRHGDIRDERSLVDPIRRPKNSTRSQEDRNDADLGQTVRAAVEYLRHH